MIRLSHDPLCESWLHLEKSLESGEIIVIDIGVTGALISKDVKKLREFKDRPLSPVSAWGNLQHYWNNRDKDTHNNHPQEIIEHFYGKSFIRFLVDYSALHTDHIPHEAINEQGYLQVYGYSPQSDPFLHRVQEFVLKTIKNYFIYVTSTNKRALQTVRGEENLKKWCLEHNIKFFSLPTDVRDTYTFRGSYPIVQAGVKSNKLEMVREGWIDIYTYLKKLKFDISNIKE